MLVFKRDRVLLLFDSNHLILKVRALVANGPGALTCRSGSRNSWRRTHISTLSLIIYLTIVFYIHVPTCILTV